MLKFYVKKGAYNTFFYGLSSLVSRALSFVFLPYFLAKLTLEEFGVWDFYQTFFSIGTLILSSTAATGLIRFFLLYKNDPKKQQAVVGNSLAFVLSGCILFQLGSFATLFLYYKNHPNFIFLLLTSLNISLFALFSLLLAYLRVKEYLWSYFFIFCGQSSLAIALTVMGIYTNQGINSFFYANCVSLIIFLPFFAYLFKNYLTFSFTIFKQQLIYSVPLLVYSFLYSFFFSIDRFFIKEYAGYEALGTYALLWRFGAIFQFFSIALIDASPVMLFNAQKEHNGNFLIAKFINYFCIAITSVCLIAIIGARIGIGLFFPEKYYFLISLLPLFFIPIIMLEVARILQFGINLSTKTIYGPLITSIGLSIQTFMLYILKDFNIHGILLANSISFALLCIIAYQLSSFIYSKAIFNPKKLSILISLFLGHTLLLQMLFYYNAPYFMLILPLASWIAALWHNNIIEQEEKNYIMTTVKKPFKIIHPKELKTILYLKTDIYFHKINSGGSFSHTIGVLDGFASNNCSLICASSTMHETLEKKNFKEYKKLSAWPLFFFARWKLGYARWHLDCLVSNISFFFQTKNLLKKYNIDAVYQRYSWLNATGLLLRLFKKIPLILEFNGSEVWIAQKAKQKSFGFFKLATFIENLNLRYADYIIVVSQPLKDTLTAQGIDAQKILVNPNGVDTEKFNPALLVADAKTIRECLLIPEQTFIFGFIGTFSFWHGIDTLQETIEHILSKQSNVHFLLIGDGPLKNKLLHDLALYKNHITYTGMLNHEVAKKYLAACNAYLCPTKGDQEGGSSFCSPTKLFEYMSMAKPVIATAVGQVAEILSPALSIEELKNKNMITDQVGILIPEKSKITFMQAAEALVTMNTEWCTQLGKNARNKVNEEFTWKKHTQNIQNFVITQK